MSTEHNSDLIIRDIRAIYDRLQVIDERFDDFDREQSENDFMFEHPIDHMLFEPVRT